MVRVAQSYATTLKIQDLEALRRCRNAFIEYRRYNINKSANKQYFFLTITIPYTRTLIHAPKNTADELIKRRRIMMYMMYRATLPRYPCNGYDNEEDDKKYRKLMVQRETNASKGIK